MKHMTFDIAFCGMDGAGKSTQIESLKNYLKDNSLEFKDFHLLSNNNSVISKLHGKKNLKSFIKNLRSLKSSPTNNFIKISLRIINVITDSWITTPYNKIKYRGKVIIYDRYFYDILAIIAKDFPNRSKLILNFAKLIPKPKLLFIFEIDPTISVRRKSDLSIKEAEIFQQLYKKISKMTKTAMVNGSLKQEIIFEEIKRKFEHIQLK